jgi:catechol 2,3-dioxygenase-like lactoylglutathione lyase family enzyme
LYRGVEFYWGDEEKPPYYNITEWGQPGRPFSRTLQDIGVARIAMRVEDIDAEAERLAELGISFLVPPTDTLIGGRKVRVIIFRDPDGQPLEYFSSAELP